MKIIKKLPFPLFPKIDDEIINAVDNKKLLIFIGAGVSKLYGYPLWDELAKKLVERGAKEKLISLSEKEVLLCSNFSSMEIVTIMSHKFDLVRQGQGVDCIIEELTSSKINKRLKNRISKYLSNYSAPIITTNADDSLETSKALSDRSVVNDFTKYDPNEHDRLSIIHLHGSIKQKSSMIFTSEQYAKAYTIDEPFGQKLTQLFNDKSWVILFLGYGIHEFELLRYFLKQNSGGSKRLFFLQGYLDKDYIKYELDKEYYLSLGIQLLPFSRERNDYCELIEVLKKWNKEIMTRTFVNSSVKNDNINYFVNRKPTKESIKIIEGMLKND